MAAKYNWKDLAGTAKKWLDNKVTETTTADRRKRDNAAGNEVQLEREMKDQLGGAALITAVPSLGRFMDRQEANAARSAQDSADRARSKRVAAVLPGSSIELNGHVSGRIDDVSVELTPDDEYGTLLVLMEPVDGVQLQGGEVVAAGFAISGFHGEGTYQLDGYIESLDPGVHHVALAGDSDTSWFYWSEEYGPGVAVVTNGLIETSLVCQNAASEQITVTMRVPMT
jgi:hypothetical protein